MNQKKSNDKLQIKIALAIQAVTVPFVILVFRLIEYRVLAASLAGGWFCLTGLIMMYLSARWPPKFRSPAFLLTTFFTLIVAFPMLVIRSLNWELPMNEIRIWGIRGDVFHGFSNISFLAMVAATFWQLHSLKATSKR